MKQKPMICPKCGEIATYGDVRLAEKPAELGSDGQYWKTYEVIGKRYYHYHKVTSKLDMVCDVPE